MAKKSKPSPEGIVCRFSFSKNSSVFFTVICLSDDEGDDNKMNISIATPVKQQLSTVVNGDNKNNTSRASDWIVQRKDVIRVPELSMKHSDLIKKSLVLRCSAVQFGSVEFYTESEMILMKETEFELKLKSKFKLINNK